jgi:hypothetical protein
LWIGAALLIGCGGSSVEEAGQVEPVEVATPLVQKTPQVAKKTSEGPPEWVGGPGTLTVVYSNNVDGEIEPCG